LSPANVPPVDEHAVGRAEILDRPAVGAGPDVRMPARDPDIVEDDLAVVAAADRAALGRQQQAAGAEEEERAEVSATGLRLFDRSSHTPGGAVDHRLAVFVARLWMGRLK